MDSTANISEIFSSIQGEGKLLGARQLFIRFAGCDLRCAWCDTPDSLVKTKLCKYEICPGIRKYKSIQNPVSEKDLISILLNMDLDYHHSISITGGEPLLQYKFLDSCIPKLHKKSNKKNKFYLETGGHRPKELKKVVKHFDYVSMDMKLQSSTGLKDFYSTHEEFIDICLKNKKDFWVKIVVTSKTDVEDILHAVNTVKKFKKKIKIYLQPVTIINNIFPPDENELLNIFSSVLNEYQYVRVIPQVHAMSGIK